MKPFISKEGNAPIKSSGQTNKQKISKVKIFLFIFKILTFHFKIKFETKFSLIRLVKSYLKSLVLCLFKYFGNFLQLIIISPSDFLA